MTVISNFSNLRLRRSALGVLLSFLVLACSRGSSAPDDECSGEDCGSDPASSSGGLVVGTGGSGAGESNSGGTGAGGVQVPDDCPTEGSGEPLSVPADTAVVAGAAPKIHLNHLGYELHGAKRAVVEASAELASFQIVRPSDSAVFFEGRLESFDSFDEWGGALLHYAADFSDLIEEGSFALLVGGETSATFEVRGGLLFTQTAGDVLGFLNKSRADDPAVWAADEAIPINGGTETHDARGGWYDASGDISKYLSHLSYANFMNPQHTPLTAWVLAWMVDEAPSVLLKAGLSDVVQSEALWGADYLVRIQSPAGFFYMNVFDEWTGDLSNRQICAYETDSGTRTSDYQAAYREGGGMTIAALARISQWGSAGDFTSSDYLAAAETGFAHLEANNLAYVDDGKENIIDDYAALMAATELFAVTAGDVYLDAARARAQALEGRLDPVGYFVADDGSRPFWHAVDAGLPVIALSRYAQVEPDAVKAAAARAAIATHLDYLLGVTSETANPFGYARQHISTGGGVATSFFIPHDNETGYWWQGESARLASLAAAALIGGRDIGEPGCRLGVSDELAGFASDQLDWIMGKNPFDVSMMAGHGRNNPPEYCSVNLEFHGHHDGGISNGITGANVDGSGIQWQDPTIGPANCWQDWRWVEQWLPHSTWYLLAVTAAAQ